MNLLQELLDTSSSKSEDIKEMKPELNEISKLFIGRNCGPVVDKKRSKEPKFFGVSHEPSKLIDKRGHKLNLTFDNSTDSGEFELNSLVPLMIEKGSDTDAAIKKLYRKYEIKSAKRTNYVFHSDKLVLREVHFGKHVKRSTVKFAHALMKLLSGQVDEAVILTEAKNRKILIADKAVHLIKLPHEHYWTDAPGKNKTADEIAKGAVLVFWKDSEDHGGSCHYYTLDVGQKENKAREVAFKDNHLDFLISQKALRPIT